MTKKPSIPRRNRVNWHYVKDDILFSTTKVVSRHQNTQQYGAILPIELTTEDIRNTTAYKEYYACATGKAAPKPKASARKLSAATKGKQPARARSPTKQLDVKRTKAEQLNIVLRRSRHEMHISQQRGSSTDEGTSSRPGDESEGEKTDESDDDDDAQKEAEKVNDAIIMRRNWLAVVNVEMMDGVIVDWGEGIRVTVVEPVVKIDSIPGSIIGFN
nr:hypothetical protein [Tanacetum cinerariifolium]